MGAAANAVGAKFARDDAKSLKRGAKAFEGSGMSGRPSRDDDDPATRAKGGRVKMKDGAGGGLGRLAKIKAYGKK